MNTVAISASSSRNVQVAAAGAAPEPVTVGGFVDEPVGGLAYASLDQAERLAGWLVARGMMSTFNTDLWNFSLRLRAATPVLVAAALLATTLITHIPARRSLRRLDVARTVRERAA